MELAESINQPAELASSSFRQNDETQAVADANRNDSGR
jgi:hypothetical protein